MAKLTDLEIGQQAADIARAKTLKALARHKVTTGRVAKRLAEALDAKETKATYDKEAGKWVYSDELIAHGPRLKAIEIASALLDMKPAEKHDVNLKGDLTINIIDRFGGEKCQK